MIDKNIKILLVEDNPGDERLIREHLRETSKTKFNIAVASSLAQALEAVKEPIYDIILLDLSLPDSFGLDTLTQLQKHTDENPLPIIVLTGLDDVEMGVKAVEQGAQDYLAKGDVDGKLLTQAINYGIKRHESEQRLKHSAREYRSLIDDVFDTSMVAVLILDQDFTVAWCNEATESYFDINRERLLGRDKREVIDSDLKCMFEDPDDYSHKLMAAYEKREFTERFECKVIGEGNRIERWLEHWSQPIREGIYEGGRIEQYLDITDRKKLQFAEEEQREFADALSDISAVITSRLELDSLLPQIVENVAQVVPHDVCSIYLSKNGSEDSYSKEQHLNYDNRNNKRLTNEQIAEVSDHYLSEVIDGGEPIIVHDLAQHRPDADHADGFDEINVTSFIGTPILFQDQIIGSLNLMSEEVNFYNAEHAERLTAFAELCAIAIKNASLYAQSRELGQINERQRLARDLHDSVSQTLFSCHTIAESALRRWARDPEKAKELVKDLHELTMTALAEMRVLLLELRPDSLVQTNIKQLFTQYLEPIQSRRGFDLVLEIDEVPDLPPDVKIAIYRITQESLNNIFKHADADKVTVKLTERDRVVKLEIADNGSGFDFDEVGTTSMGLNIMRERAEGISASLEISTEESIGTSVELIWKNRK